IRFFFLSKSITIRNRKKLKAFMIKLLRKEGKRPGNINFIFCSDEYLLDINRNYLNHNYYTDIITFDLSSNPASLEAEIYISTDRVRDNARSMNTTITEEIHRVMFHGLLHLSGYRDKNRKDLKIMREREGHYISKYKNVRST
ncbi:MAG: rRNA maturation RNase YbeY, partial [Bacteroidota bacterium]